jgi:hypothetical protein
MKSLLILVAFLVAFGLTSCTTTANLQTDLSSPTVQQTALITLETSGNVAMATQKNTAAKQTIANQLVAVGAAVQTLASGGTVTSAQLQSTIAKFSPKDATAAAGYSTITTALLSAWTVLFPNLDSNAAIAAQWVNLLGQAAQQVGTVNGGVAQ